MGIPSQYLGPVFLFLGVVIIVFMSLLTLTSCYVHGSYFLNRQATVRGSRRAARKKAPDDDPEANQPTENEAPAVK